MLRAALLAIGTELTSGEILDRNSAWISEELYSLGITPLLHLSVRDESPEIVRAFDYVSSEAELIVTTGGLGPTKDDLTREALSEWLGIPNEFDPDAFQRLENLMKARGRSFRENQKQQCYKPPGSFWLSNEVGTAEGIYLPLKEGSAPSSARVVVCLPGPPSEIASIWGCGLSERLTHLPGRGHSHHLFRFQFEGLPESELAEEIENLVAQSNVKTAYRLDRPKIHVKLWVDPSQLEEFQRLWSTRSEKLKRHEVS